MDQLLAIPELLENILLFLPLADLIRTQRISKLFDATITSSPRIQQGLFFRPILNRLPDSPGGASRNPGTLPTQPSYYCPASELLSEAADEHVANPLLAHYFRFWFDEEEIGSTYDRRRPSRHEFRSLPIGLDDATLEAFMRPEASWRRMLVCQPPIPKLGMELLSSSMARQFGYSGQVDLENEEGGGEGVRMGVLYDICFAWIHEMETVSSFSVEWDCVNGPEMQKPTGAEQDSGLDSIQPRDGMGRLTVRLINTLHLSSEPRPVPLPEFKSKGVTKREVLLHLKWSTDDWQFEPSAKQIIKFC